jgi:hypothetical protein
MAFVDYTLATAMFDPSNKEEAVTAIMEAVKCADKIYAEVARDYNDKALFEARNRKYAQVYEYADKKYKRQANRDKYIDKEMKAWEALPMYRKFWPHDESIEFVDYQFDPRAMGIPSVCIVDTQADRAAYEAMYEMVKDNDYFKHATGLSIVITIDTDEKYINSHFRPHAKLVLPEDLEKQYIDAENSLAEGVARFYDGCTHFGD